MKHIISALTLAILITALFTIAATGQEKHRPKVGLVLSGGGAKGMAHIGVIKVLEQAGITPDYITGTSMGSIIGGLYSVGYSADEIYELVTTINWDEVLTNEVPLNKIVMEEKEDYGKHLGEFSLDNHKFSLPSGFIEGQKLSALFSELTWCTAGIESFDDYPIPFRCTGVDLLSGEIYEFSNGDLSTAMRSSMSIPSVFSPMLIKTDTQEYLIVDGGVIRNFPVSEVIAMGADIVIGVYSGFKEDVDVNDLASLTSVLSRSTLLIGIVDSKSQALLTQYMVTPDLDNYSPSSFNSAANIVEQGRIEAAKQFQVFKALADSLNSIEPSVKPLPLIRPDSLYVSDIIIENLKFVDETLVKGRIGIEPASYITLEQLNYGIEEVYGTLYFDKVSYQFKNTQNGLALVVSVKEKPQAIIKSALHYDNYYGVGITLNFTKRNLWLKGTRFTASVNLSKYPQLKLYYHKYLGKKQNSLLSYSINFSENILPVYEQNEPIGSFHQSYIVSGLAFRQSYGLNNQVGAGFEYEFSDLRPTVSIRELEPTLDFERYGYSTLGVVAFFSRNNLDHMLYPTQGLNFSIFAKQTFNTKEVYTYGEEENLNTDVLDVNPYYKSQMMVDYYHSILKNTILRPTVEIGVASKDIHFADYFYIGGYKYNLRPKHVSFIGLDHNEAFANNYFKAGFEVNQIVFKNLFLIARTNWITGYGTTTELFENILVNDPNSNVLGYGGGVTLRSKIGPLSFLVGGNNKNTGLKYYLSLGFNFSGIH